MAHRTVLLTADPERRSDLKTILRDNGYDVVEAGPGSDLASVCREASAEIVVADADAVARAGAPIEEIAGSSAAARALRRAVDLAASSESPVLLSGPRGAAFERIASAIHARSSRRAGAFVALACSTLPPALADAELMGRDPSPGRIGRAAGGTLFIEEISVLGAQAQEALHREIDGSARIFAATTADLGARVAEGKFRADLLGRLSECVIEVPSLRSRVEDLPGLVERHLASHRRALGGATPTITAEALDRLARHSWPGDVRELETVLDRALALGRGDRIDADDLALGDRPLDETELSAERSYFKASVAALERELITTALRDAGGNRSRAADLLGIYRRLLYAKIKEYGLEGYPKKQR